MEQRSPPRRGPDVRPFKRGRPGADIFFQGVRITLSTNGSPMLYEVLGRRGSVRQIYTVQSVEAAARAEFGSALPGRRHAVERSLNDAPDVVVPRILDEPGTVMGPILYLRAEMSEVATLICRCMDSQAKMLVGQGYYELASSPLPASLRAPTGSLDGILRLPTQRRYLSQ